jgi:formate hydrogenlyase subunit 6/NADH:ubiquinone oxidoreductase subunit I
LELSEDSFNAKGYHPVVVIDADQCIGCASCATICPDVVFTVYRRKRQPTPRKVNQWQPAGASA